MSEPQLHAVVVEGVPARAPDDLSALYFTNKVGTNFCLEFFDTLKVSNKESPSLARHQRRICLAFCTLLVDYIATNGTLSGFCSVVSKMGVPQIHFMNLRGFRRSSVSNKILISEPRKRWWALNCSKTVTGVVNHVPAPFQRRTDVFYSKRACLFLVRRSTELLLHASEMNTM